MNALINGDLEADAAETRRKLDDAAGIEILCPRSADACGVSVRLWSGPFRQTEPILRWKDMP